MPTKNKPLIHLIAAARPNFMKIAPLYHALKREPWCEVRLVHTGQHYDENMSDAFFRDLELPRPHIHLEVGSGSHAEQTGGVMIAYERICVEQQPDWIVVVGDVNSTAACALVGAKLHVPVAHLEAGLRSRDRTMPEEINRLVTDVIADLLWTPSPDADDNLRHEGIPAEKIVRVGNIMIDSYELLRSKIHASKSAEHLAVTAGNYGVVTLHRPANVDDEATLTLITEQLVAAAHELPLIFAVHPRTQKRLQSFGLARELQQNTGLKLVDPLGYIDFMGLIEGAKLVITDSGGLQEETTYLGIPCLTLRPNTERPITCLEGSNRLITAPALLDNVREALTKNWPKGQRPALWDGHTAERVVESLKQAMESA